MLRFLNVVMLWRSLQIMFIWKRLRSEQMRSDCMYRIVFKYRLISKQWEFFLKEELSMSFKRASSQPFSVNMQDRIDWKCFLCYNRIEFWTLSRRSRRSSKHRWNLHHLLPHPQPIPTKHALNPIRKKAISFSNYSIYYWLCF